MHPSDRTSLVLIFGPRQLLGSPTPLELIRRLFPNAQLVGCSTAGEIAGAKLSDGELVFTAIEFERSQVRVVTTDLVCADDSRQAGKRLASQLLDSSLVHVFVLSDGLHVNGSELVRGIVEQLPAHVAVTGGLAGDAADFKQTLVHCNGTVAPQQVVGIGFYGSHLRVGYGSGGGWEPFGPARVVTRSKANVLYELDGESALSLYRKYLGEHAAGLPASALNFPLSVRPTAGSTAVVRTILRIDEQTQSMTFAGDIPEGMYARLMHADINRLIDGASNAAKVACGCDKRSDAELAILISCVGRKLVLKQRVEEEIEAVRDVLGTSVTMTGFYSYGEICPFGPREQSALHNQTMTVTTFTEVP
jgi:hypothetical protein